MPPSKATKKRKVNVDPSQYRMDRFLSTSLPQSPIEDAMQVDQTPPPQPPQQTEEYLQSKVSTVNVSSLLGTFRQQSLIPCITIANANPARPKELPDAFFQSSWKIQKTLLIAIFSNHSSNINYVTASKLSESLCRYGKSQEIYNALKQEIENHVSSLKNQLLSVPLNQGILNPLYSSWTTFCSQLAIIRNVFMELDRSFILPNTKFSSIIQLGKHIFSDTVMESTQFRNMIVAEVLNLIKLDRDNQTVDIKLIQAILQMMIELSFYTADFEPRFLTSTNTYYKEESNKLINELSMPDYIQHANKRKLQESNERITNYLDIHTKQPLTIAVTNQLVYTQTEIIIKKGFDDMVTNDMMETLKILYDLLSSNSTKLNLLRIAFGEYIKKQGVALISNPQNDKDMVGSLLKFKTKLDTLLNQCFDNDVSFQNSLKESFEHFMNTRGNKPAELLAKFIDSKLKISPKKKNEIDIPNLNSTLALFRYIQGKDAFEVYYKRFLAKRLLMDRSCSSEIENHILENLKVECGHEFTKNLESMFNDIQISLDLNVAFRDFERGTSRMSLNVKVISQAIWPPSPPSDVLLPRQMLESQRLYEKFYASKYNGRQLVWNNTLSNCSLTSHFPKGTKDVSVTIPQAAILLLFNDKSRSISFTDILHATKLNEKDLMRLIASVSTGSYQLLINESSSGESIKRTDRFKYNEEFECANNKLKVPTAQLEQVVEEQKAVEEKVFRNRQHQLDAAIVRIMKSKKTSSHAELVNEILIQLNYPVDATDVKKRIGSLIDKDYLIRDTEDSSIYIYQS